MSDKPNHKDIYVAGKWFDKDRIGKKIEILEKMGYNITHNWTKVEVGTTRCSDNYPEITPEIDRDYADRDIKGVTDASLLVVDMCDEKYPYRGTWTEIGVALGQRAVGQEKEIWIISPNKRSTNIFFYSSGILHFESWSQVFSELY